MLNTYITSLILLFLSHALLSAPYVRKRLMTALPKAVFYIFYSLISLGALLYVMHSYQEYQEYDAVYVPLWELRPLVLALMPIAFILVICRISSPYPKTAVPYGIYAICRFPGSLGIMLWAGLHIMSVGDVKRLALFTCMMAIALFAIIKNTLVLKISSPAFIRSTAILPFGITPRHGWRRTMTEIGITRPLVALAGYGAMLYLHALIFGVSPLAGL